MCVAVLKPAGAECPPMSVLADCWDANKDGAGVAVSERDSVFIRKGFMKFGDFEDWFYKAKLNSRVGQAIVFHFRIGTSGLKDGGNTHPFPVSLKPKTLRRLSGRFPLAVAHNGVFNNKVTLPDVSDTGQFMADCAAAGGDPLKFWDANRSVTGWSRLVVLKPCNEYALRGDWHCIEGSGCLFSNISWKRYAVPTVAKKPSMGFHGSYGGDELEYQDWWDRVPSGSYGTRKPYVASVKPAGLKDTVVFGVRYVPKYADPECIGIEVCSKCAVQTQKGGGRTLQCGDFDSACTLNKSLYWLKADETKPATGIMTDIEVNAAGGVSAAPGGNAPIKIVRTNPANGQEYVSYVAEGGKLDGFGGTWSPG